MKILLKVLMLAATVATTNAVANEKTESVILAGGCFWCIESDYEKLDGVVEVISGYAGGKLKNPTYKQVSGGNSGHIEVVKVIYKPSVISFKQIIDYFWVHVDPTRNDGQFCDRGPQYRPAIFYKNSKEHEIILESQNYVNEHKTFAEALQVELIAGSEFYDAEDYHQDYYKKNPVRYHFYRFNCGRDARIKELWNEYKLPKQ